MHKDASLGASAVAITFRENILFSIRASHSPELRKPKSAEIRGWRDRALIKKLSWPRGGCFAYLGFAWPFVDRPHRVSRSYNFESQSPDKCSSRYRVISLETLFRWHRYYYFCG